MENRKGFTLVELMVVILIVGILAAVAIPIMRGRIDAAKWSEGKSMMGTIATGIRAYVAEHGGEKQEDGTYGTITLDDWVSDLGFREGDLDGTYFTEGCFSIPSFSYDPAGDPPLTFTIQCDSDGGENTLDLRPPIMYLTHDGVFTDVNPSG